MADTAAHLVDRVLPEVPSGSGCSPLPYPLRYRYAHAASLTRDVLRAFVRALFAELRRRAQKQWDIRPPKPHGGATARSYAGGCMSSGDTSRVRSAKVQR